MALQALNRLKSEYPDLVFDYVVSEECRILAEGSPLIRRVHVIPSKTLQDCVHSGEFTDGINAMNTFLRDLSRISYLLSMNFFQEYYGGVIQSFVTAERKTGLEFREGSHFHIESRYMEHLAAIPVARGDNGWHAIDVYLRTAHWAFEKLGLTRRSNLSKLPASWTGKAGEILSRISRPKCAEKLLPGQYLVFHPGSAWPGKCWPAEHWAQLTTLCFRAGLEIAFTGAAEELPVLERILNGMDTQVAAAMVLCVGKTTLLELAWLTGNARLVVTGDTVAMHLAAGTLAPVLALFGPSNPIETGPYGRGHVIFQTDPAPLPNFQFSVPHAGLNRLVPETIADYILYGKVPEQIDVWQTDWDAGLDRQVLKNSRQEFHPACLRAKALIRTLDHYRIEEAMNTVLPTLTGVRESLRLELLGAIANPGPAALQRLEAVEKNLAEQTQLNLIWEAYRIAINGLSLQNFPVYLRQRQTRFYLALQEENQVNKNHMG